MMQGVEALVTGFSEAAAAGVAPGAFRELLDALPAAVYTTDAAGTITFVNRAAIELAGRTPTVGEDQWCVTFRLYSPDGILLPHDVRGPVSTMSEALDVIGSETFDLAVLDINIRGDMSFPVADALLARNVPLIFLTGYDADVLPERFSALPRLG